MLNQLFTLFIGILGGIAVGIQTPVANLIGKRVGATASSFIVHLGGAIISGIILLIQGGEQLGNFRSLTWWMWIAGVYGLVLVLTVNYTIPRLGVTAGVTLIIVGQLLTGMILDHFGLLESVIRPIDGTRIIAAVLLLAGAYLMAR